MSERLFYLNDYTDEVMPCAPTLEAWAAWLADPGEAWGEPVKDGAELAGSTLDVLHDTVATRTADGWKLSPEPPPTADFFGIRICPGSFGWDGEHAGDTAEMALSGVEPDDDEIHLAVCRSGPDFRARFDAAGPRLVILGNVQ